MRVIYPNVCIIDSASTAQTGYPASDAVSKHLHAVWKPETGDSSPDITVLCRSSANSVLIDNITAAGMTVTIYSPTGDTVKTQAFDLQGEDDYYGTYQIPRVWLDYDVQAMNHKIKLDITKGSVSEISVGMIYVGRTLNAFSNPEWGFGGSPEDFSVIWDLDKGYRDTFKGNVIREFAISHKIHHDTDQFHALKRRMTDIGTEPAAWLIHETSTPQHEYIIYGCAEQNSFKWEMPKYGTNKLSYTLKEFL